jgi:hypothetical protein
MAGDNTLKVRENRARRAAQRQGISISKNARRDPRALDYGLWSLDDPHHGIQHTDLRLDQIETYLTTGQLPTQAQGATRKPAPPEHHNPTD